MRSVALAAGRGTMDWRVLHELAAAAALPSAAAAWLPPATRTCMLAAAFTLRSKLLLFGLALARATRLLLL